MAGLTMDFETEQEIVPTHDGLMMTEPTATHAPMKSPSQYPWRDTIESIPRPIHRVSTCLEEIDRTEDRSSSCFRQRHFKEKNHTFDLARARCSRIPATHTNTLKPSRCHIEFFWQHSPYASHFTTPFYEIHANSCRSTSELTIPPSDTLNMAMVPCSECKML